MQFFKEFLCFVLSHNTQKLQTFSDFTAKVNCTRCQKQFHVDRLGNNLEPWDDILESIYKHDRGPFC